jgi:hypothetical protein
MIYQNYVRVIDCHRVLHLARLEMRPSEALCGEPPNGNTWSDPAADTYLPGALTGDYREICVVCNRLAGGDR